LANFSAFRYRRPQCSSLSPELTLNRRSKTEFSGDRSTRPSGGASGSTMLDPTFLDAVVELIGKAPAGAPAKRAAVAASNRTALVSDLRSFGEDSVASAIEVAADESIWAIGQRAMQLAFSGENITRSLCLAAVERIEGQARPLARKRRKRARPS
jgi:hypothetical protein